jgi:hypothetical protein
VIIEYSVIQNLDFHGRHVINTICGPYNDASYPTGAWGFTLHHQDQNGPAVLPASCLLKSLVDCVVLRRF